MKQQKSQLSHSTTSHGVPPKTDYAEAARSGGMNFGRGMNMGMGMGMPMGMPMGMNMGQGMAPMYGGFNQMMGAPAMY